MSAGARATRHAGGLYRRAFKAIARPARKLEAEAHHLEEVERAGESAETPLIVFLGVFLFLLPVFVLMLGLAFAAYYLAT
jgi:VIT1/CCC1 family predicted Fe2+/Mn2+ transporter